MAKTKKHPIVGISIKAEPSAFFKEFKQYERCYFCKSPTNFWSVNKNKPVCPECSISHNESEII